MISAIISSGVGNTEPTAILMASAVRSPSRSEYSFFTNWMMASSSSSPPTRRLDDVTIPPSEITATSVVPPPMSTTMLPVGSWMGRPAPMAAAMGSSMMNARRAPAEMVASSTARCSTPVIPLGTHTTTRGFASTRRRCTFWMKYRSIFSVTSKSAMTPSFRGRTARMCDGVRPIIRLASDPTARMAPFSVLMATTEGSFSTMPRPRT